MGQHILDAITAVCAVSAPFTAVAIRAIGAFRARVAICAITAGVAVYVLM